MGSGPRDSLVRGANWHRPSPNLHPRMAQSVSRESERECTIDQNEDNVWLAAWRLQRGRNEDDPEDYKGDADAMNGIHLCLPILLWLANIGQFRSHPG